MRWLLAVTAVAACLAFVWAVTLRRRVKQQTAIISQQIARESVLGERQRIARELHDTLEQELVGMGMQLETTARHLKDQPSEAKRALELARRMLRHSREESRSSIRDLRSLALENLGLRGAADELLRPLAEIGGAQLIITAKPGEERLPRLYANHFLRIAHEAVANAARHGSPATITVSFDFREDCALLEIRDDGCGFDAATLTATGDHFGIEGMQERTEKMRGSFVLESAPGRGTRILVTVPLDRGVQSVEGDLAS